MTKEYKQHIVGLWLVVFTAITSIFIVYGLMGDNYSYISTVVFISLIFAVGVLGSITFYLQNQEGVKE